MRIFIVEVPQHEMQKRFPHSPTAGFYFTKTSNQKDINQFLNDRFGTINYQYEFFTHDIDFETIKQNHLTVFPVYYGYRLLEDMGLEFKELKGINLDE